jgi:hypothetical protein
MRRLQFLPFIFSFILLWSCTKSFDEQQVEKDKLSAPGKTNLAASVPTSGIGAAGIAGVNWADARDNFVDGWVIPSGLEAVDSYEVVAAKANAILTGFQNNMPGVNTIRLPINPPSVREIWWDSYSAAINVALGKNMKVILACWEGASSRNGLVDDIHAFWKMWDKVVKKYGENPNVYFEVFNEPHGYSLTDLTTLYADWLSKYPNVPRGRILLGGSGYSENVTQIGADSRFSDCLLSLHNYAFWTNRNTVADWEQSWRNGMGAYAARTVVTEYGAGMTTGKNYTGVASGDNEILYIQGSTNVFRYDGVASVYWPGLRDGDSYSIQTRSGSGTNLTLQTTNASGLDRIRFGWGQGSTVGGILPNVNYRIINRNSGQPVDVNGGSTANGASIIQWGWNGGANQQWQFVGNDDGTYRILNRNSGKALDVDGGSTTDGAKTIQWDYWGGQNQRWEVIDQGNGYYKIINKNSGKALDVNGGSTNYGASIIQWAWNGGNNQQWMILQQ